MTGNENPGSAGGRKAGADTQENSSEQNHSVFPTSPQRSRHERPDFSGLASIPAIAELAPRRQWCVWRSEQPRGNANATGRTANPTKATKVPYVADRGSPRKLSTTNPRDYRSFTDAIAAFDTGSYSGIGFIFTADDPYIGVDLDSCVGDDSTLAPWAAEIVAKFGSYAEFSPSGKGVHVICKGELPKGSRHRRGNIEVYDRGRYFTVTGKLVPNAIRTIEDGSQGLAFILSLIEKRPTTTSPSASQASQASDALAILIREIAHSVVAGAFADPKKLDALQENSPAFAHTWRRSIKEKYPSSSEWDLAVANDLVRAGWSNGEIVAALIEHRRTHGGSPKLRPDYYARTILKARKTDKSPEAASAPIAFDFAALVERAKADSGAPYEDDAIAALVRLCGQDRAAFERVRAGLKKTGVRLGSLDDAIQVASGGELGSKRETQAQSLVTLALSESELSHNAEGTCFADFRVGGHRETWNVRTKQFKQWIAKRFFEKTRGAPASDAMQSALNAIEAHARFDGSEREVYMRVANVGDCIYIDLCDKEWRVIKIDRNGWLIVVDPPVRFRRTRGMLRHPDPVRGGSVEELRTFINLRKPRKTGGDESDDFILIVAWLVAALRGVGPFAILAIKGEQGSAKSTVARILRSLVDPNTAAIRSLPRNDHDLFIAANNGYVLSFDNVSKLSAWLSDSLCCISTGGGYATRELWTDGEEAIFNVICAIILNGIEDYVSRPDLADRVIDIILGSIPDEQRKPEAELWKEFDRARPRIFGALLDAVSHGLRNIANVRLEKLPRMADFARWVVACEGTLPWPGGSFMRCYDANRASIQAVTLESDAVASGIRTFMSDRSEWSGTATDLLRELNKRNADASRHDRDWPNTSRGLSGRLRRAAPGLRRMGIEAEFTRAGTKGSRIIRLFVSEVNSGE